MNEDDEQDIGMCCAKVNMKAQKQIRSQYATHCHITILLHLVNDRLDVVEEDVDIRRHKKA